ncbi:hypothetical protein BTO05_13335 [Winogradskyella sp. PC-19]|uniref:hypothetical protein n=1 Tax=unclassified Winogradskyella TaxID=2615021 RepID=UPI000B3D275E|nr:MULTISPECIES: hypothetical protein [unclassified Winogradskyella]ARV10568.1 hypothetical protein BTO05_13335 [Winogradskyella sp. PC-19]RZN75297.1 MAG: hypothetical protein EVB12_07445 [Winogradskyella sp.]
MWKYILAWFPMILVAIVNGLFREKFLKDHLNELQAHQMSTASMIVLFGIYVWVLFKIWLPISVNQAVTIGVIWLVLTIIFEFLFGHYIAGHSWDKLLHDYNLFQGRVWILVLIWISIVPYVIYQLQR